MAIPDLDHLRPLQEEIKTHPLGDAVEGLGDLRIFMAHHVYSVWDFMSLIKCLQGHLAPERTPWVPLGDPALRHFINRMALEEESARIPTTGGGCRYASRLDLYCEAMEQIGADASRPRRFFELVAARGLEEALRSDLIPPPARAFCRTTFRFIRSGRPHEAAAALIIGRERLLPFVYQTFLARVGVTPVQAPSFHFFMNRDYHLDDRGHIELGLRLLSTLSGDDPRHLAETAAAAEESVRARRRLWDGILAAVRGARQT